MSVHITRLHIEGYRRFKAFDLQFNSRFNAIVGDNETGKSSLLEAIALVLTGQYDGRHIQYGIDPYIFNVSDVANFFELRQRGEQARPPRVLIEAYLQKDENEPTLATLSGTNNTRAEDCPGLVLALEVESDHVEALKDYAADGSNPTVLPMEFYRVTWTSFAGNAVNPRRLPLRAATIDTAHARVHHGPNRYLAQRVKDVLSESQRRDLSLAYKKLRHGFAQEPGVAAINADLEARGNPATTKKLSVQMDMSSRAAWDSAITPHLDALPLECAGKGEQSRVQMRLAIAGEEKSQVLLIEEPENHLSHANLNMLMDEIRTDCAERQVIITTHSAFVLNKMGLDNLRLISKAGQAAALAELAPDTKNYFLKLPGYDTLRLILAKRSILVEGPSDELIVQRAYRDRHGKLPIEDGVDVISVGALAFKRFLDIAVLLGGDVCVVTDNDGDVEAVRRKYAHYLDEDRANIRICYDEDENCRTLEPQLLKANSRQVLNRVLDKRFADDAALLKHMADNKTDCALKFFEAEAEWNAPGYIEAAIA